MRYTKFLSFLTAAIFAAAPVSMNAYAEVDDINQLPQENVADVTDNREEPTLTTAPKTTEQIVTTTYTTAAESTSTTSSTLSVVYTTTTSKVTTAYATETVTTTAATTTIPVTTTTTETTVNSVKVKPVCEHVNEADINGRALIDIPDGANAEVSIEYASPEYDAHQYYKISLLGGKVYSFDIEGRDTAYDDYRIYTLTVQLTGGKYNVTADTYTDTFTVPDGNDNPDSFKTLSYKFTIDDAKSDTVWNVVSDAEDKKEIAVHLDYIMLGDINGDSSVDASDASLVLFEYASLSTGGASSLTSRQKISADVNNDDIINSSDASKILEYYSAVSTGGNPSWE